MKFNSQICTTREQSERLLALGLKKETADMTWDYSHTMKGIPQYDCRAESTWDPETFARYVEHCENLGYFEHWKHSDGSQMAPEEVYAEITKKNIPAWSLHRLWELDNINYIKLDNKEEIAKLYGCIIDNIEAQIKEGNFNKEYLV